MQTAINLSNKLRSEKWEKEFKQPIIYTKITINFQIIHYVRHFIEINWLIWRVRSQWIKIKNKKNETEDAIRAITFKCGKYNKFKEGGMQAITYFPFQMNHQHLITLNNELLIGITSKSFWMISLSSSSTTTAAK